GLKFGRKLLYFPFSFGFRLLGIGRRALQRSFPLFCKLCRVHLRAVGNQRPKVRRELLQSLCSVRFYLRGIAGQLPRPNGTAVRYSFFPLIQCFLSFIQSLLARVEVCFPLSKLCFSCRILFLAGANHSETDQRRNH